MLLIGVTLRTRRRQYFAVPVGCRPAGRAAADALLRIETDSNAASTAEARLVVGPISEDALHVHACVLFVASPDGRAAHNRHNVRDTPKRVWLATLEVHVLASAPTPAIATLWWWWTQRGVASSTRRGRPSRMRLCGTVSHVGLA